MPPTAPSHPCGYARNPEPLTHLQLMVVYPASWSICIIGPAWSLIVLYFAPALALWRIGTLVGSQVWLCMSSAQPASPMPAGEPCPHLWAVSPMHRWHSETSSKPFVIILGTPSLSSACDLRFHDIGPAPSLHWPLDPARIHGLAPRYIDGTPGAHPSPVQPFSVLRALRLLATSSLCLRHRISARFHPASLPGLYALVRSTVSPLV
ncbi:hypothetical protein GGX14DRAFT_555808 [Mycena pura]|uniref:Uncharacterized protein n=1 Tax=Mycena pura TaxID=153505 RepID=A0AAD7E413_9AGAR|nr:hypothetical protein GGX14DRAFT_555808 [Mycena pura]